MSSRSKEAYNALKQALKHRFDSAKIWGNFVIVCVELRKVTEIIYAYHRLLDIDERHVDLPVSDISPRYFPDSRTSEVLIHTDIEDTCGCGH